MSSSLRKGTFDNMRRAPQGTGAGSTLTKSKQGTLVSAKMKQSMASSNLNMLDSVLSGDNILA